MTLSIDELFITRQLLGLGGAVAAGIATDAANNLETFIAINERLQAQRDLLCATRTTSAEAGCDGETGRWLVPSPRVVRAYAIWRQEACSRGLVAAHPERLRVALVVGGGVGDHIKASAVIPDLLRIVDADIYYVTDHILASDIFRNNPFVRKVLRAGRNPHELAEESLAHLPLFDLIATWKYAIEYFVPPLSRLPAETAAALTRLSDERAGEFRKYYYCNEMWPKYNQFFGRTMTRRGLNALNIGGFTASREPSSQSSTAFFPDRRSLGVADALGLARYVTVHHGFDLNHLPTKSTKTTYGSTKNIPLRLWQEICATLRAAGIGVVQLGATGEEEIPGITRNLSGLTTLSETALILKHAICHVDTEGGLVHLARAVHTRSVVLFGPTPVDVFGYLENINIEPRGCKACWYVAPNWVVQCPRLTEGPHCMQEHRANDVVAAVNEILAATCEIAGEVVAGLDPVPDDGAAILAAPCVRDGLQNATDVLYVGERVDDALLRVLDPHDDSGVCIVAATDVPGHELGVDAVTATLRDGRITLCSMFNLPTESASADLVICRSSVWLGEYRRHAMREMFRVLRPGGMLVAWSEQGSGPAGLDIAAILTEAGFPATFASGAPRDPAGAFVIAKRGAAEPASRPVFRRAATADGVPTAPAADAPEAYRRELELLVRAGEERIFDTYRCYVQRNHLNDAIWSNRHAILKLSLDRNGWISPSSEFCDGYATFFTAKGWHSPEIWGVWGAGRKHTLLLPLTEACVRTDDIILEVQIDLPLMELTPQRTVSVRAGGAVLAVWTCCVNRETRSVRIPAGHAALGGVLEVEFQVEVSVIPSQLGTSRDDRELGMGLRQFRYRTMSDESAGR